LSDKETSSIENTSLALAEEDEPIIPSGFVTNYLTRNFSQTSNPLAEKITESHITKVLDNSEKDSEREFEFNKLELKDQQSSKWFFLAIFIISLIFIGFIIVFLSGVDKETMRFVLGIIVGFIGGFGAKGLLPQSKKKSD
jgi:small-conductance mechanosensitive channel